MLEEAIEVMETLWSGGYHSYAGKHYTVHDARIFTLPDEPPPILVAASGSESASLAVRVGGGMVATEPKADLVERFRQEAGDQRPVLGQLAMAVDDDVSRARRAAHDVFRFSALGWKVMSELPNPVNFEAATAYVREEDTSRLVSCGPDPEVHLDGVRQWTDAGFDHIAIVAVGDTDRFFDAWEQELRPRVS
jgi:G6PDH family F420-dependent oxidoreductase